MEQVFHGELFVNYDLSSQIAIGELAINTSVKLMKGLHASLLLGGLSIRLFSWHYERRSALPQQPILSLLHGLFYFSTINLHSINIHNNIHKECIWEIKSKLELQLR